MRFLSSRSSDGVADVARAQVARREAAEWRDRASRGHRVSDDTEDYLERAAECERRARSWGAR